MRTEKGFGYTPKNFELALDPNGVSSATFSGKFRLMVDYWRVAQSPQYSDVLENPSWDDILLAVDNMLDRCKSDYIFLEELAFKKPDSNGVAEIELGFGS
jgi:hypothetical protein